MIRTYIPRTAEVYHRNVRCPFVAIVVYMMAFSSDCCGTFMPVSCIQQGFLQSTP